MTQQDCNVSLRLLAVCRRNLYGDMSAASGPPQARARPFYSLCAPMKPEPDLPMTLGNVARASLGGPGFTSKRAQPFASHLSFASRQSLFATAGSRPHRVLHRQAA